MPGVQQRVSRCGREVAVPRHPVPAGTERAADRAAHEHPGQANGRERDALPPVARRGGSRPTGQCHRGDGEPEVVADEQQRHRHEGQHAKVVAQRGGEAHDEERHRERRRVEVDEQRVPQQRRRRVGDEEAAL